MEPMKLVDFNLAFLHFVTFTVRMIGRKCPVRHKAKISRDIGQ